MEITSVKVYPVGKGERFLGYADVVFDNSFIVRGFRVMKSKAGKISAAAPIRKQTKRDKELKRHVELFHPIESGMREKLDAAVADAVEKQAVSAE